jgi:hypothetical protein
MSEGGVDRCAVEHVCNLFGFWGGREAKHGFHRTNSQLNYEAFRVNTNTSICISISID